MPHAEVQAEWRPATEATARFDASVVWKGPRGTVRYLVEEKRHFRHQDAAVMANQLVALRDALPRGYADDRLLLLAPHVRPQQAAVLERAGIDYLDLAGNAHLTAPGLFVHVEGRKPVRPPVRAGRVQKGWIKVVMALLIRPDLVDAPYRVLADEAGVALGTVAGCMTDLTTRGFLGQRKNKREIRERQELVARWVQAYVETLRPKLAEGRFQVRAETKQEIWAGLQAALAAQGGTWALTGADAAERTTHFFHAEETEIYAPARVLEDADTRKALVAQPAGRGGNLLVIEPPGPLAIPEGDTKMLPVAPLLLAYAELRYRGTDQALEAAEQILPKVLERAAD